MADRMNRNPAGDTNDEPRKNVGNTSMSQRSLKVLFFVVFPLVGFLLAIVGHLVIS